MAGLYRYVHDDNVDLCEFLDVSKVPQLPFHLETAAYGFAYCVLMQSLGRQKIVVSKQCYHLRKKSPIVTWIVNFAEFPLLDLHFDTYILDTG